MEVAMRPNQHTGQTACHNGHPYTTETLYVRPDGSRSCRLCRKSEKLNSQRAPVDPGALSRCLKARADGVTKLDCVSRFGSRVATVAEAVRSGAVQLGGEAK